MSTGSEAARDLDGYEEDLPFQRRFWRAERIAWGLYAALILASLSGLTGSGGMFARSQIELATATIDFPRVSRWQTPTTVSIHLHGADPSLVLLEEAFLELFEIKTVVPAPLSARATPAGVFYTFDAMKDGVVRFDIQARRPAFFADASFWIGEEKASVRPVILP
jgi:hypothetical protein